MAGQGEPGDLDELSKKIGYKFKDKDLLNRALTHSSYTNERGLDRMLCNERLEFLGDSLLSMIVSVSLYHHTPTMSEGDMTKQRAVLVCEKSLCACANKIGLGSYMIMGRGEAGTGGRSRPSILADAFEALIAAVYIDGGIKPTEHFVECSLCLHNMEPAKTADDYKSILQEYIQDKPGMHHHYKHLSQEGPDHDKTFTVQVLINDRAMGIGTGKSKKSAEQAAAKIALSELQNHLGTADK